MVAILFFVSASFVIAANPPKLEQIEYEGRIYHDLELMRAEVAHATFYHSTGLIKVPISVLPAEVQEQIGYDPAKADAWLQEEREKQQELYLEKLEKIAERKAQFEEIQRIKKEEEEKTRAEEERRSQLLSTATEKIIKVLQVFVDGILAEEMNESTGFLVRHDRYDCEPFPYRIGRIGGYFGVAHGTRSLTPRLSSFTSYHPTGNLLFVEGFGGVATGTTVYIKAYRDGARTIQDTSGTHRTLEKWHLAGKVERLVAISK